MKKLLAILLLVSSSTVLADGYHGSYHHSGDWVSPFVGGVLTGVIIYNLTRPRVVVQQPLVYNWNNQPIYQYQDIYDSTCNCYRRVLVQIN